MNALFTSSSFQLACILTILGTFDTTNGNYAAFTDRLPTGYIYHPEIKTAYKLFTTKLTWSDARLACESNEARLAIIDTSEKLGYVTSLRSWGTWVWTGIFKDSLLSNYVGVNGEALPAHLPWGILGNTYVGDCVAVSGLSGGLANSICSLRYMYICEIPGERRAINVARQNY